MAEIDQISWRKFEKFLLKIGCTFKRQKGDHRIYWKPGNTQACGGATGTGLAGFYNFE